MQISLTRASILTWYCDSSSLIPPQALPTKTGVKPPSLVTFVPIVSLPLPPSSFCAPMTLEEAVAPGPARVTTEELCPLVLLLQQYALGCLFRAEMSAEEQGRRAELLAELWRNEAGTPLEWKALLERAMEQPSPESEEKQAAEKKRVDAMMTSVFGTLTKGCVGADTLACERFRTKFPLPDRVLTASLHSPFHPSVPPISRPPRLRLHRRPLLKSREARRLLRAVAQGAPPLRSAGRAAKSRRNAHQRGRQAGV